MCDRCRHAVAGPAEDAHSAAAAALVFRCAPPRGRSFRSTAYGSAPTLADGSLRAAGQRCNGARDCNRLTRRNSSYAAALCRGVTGSCRWLTLIISVTERNSCDRRPTVDRADLRCTGYRNHRSYVIRGGPYAPHGQPRTTARAMFQRRPVPACERDAAPRRQRGGTRIGDERFPGRGPGMFRVRHVVQSAVSRSARSGRGHQPQRGGVQRGITQCGAQVPVASWPAAGAARWARRARRVGRLGERRARGCCVTL